MLTKTNNSVDSQHITCGGYQKSFKAPLSDQTRHGINHGLHKGAFFFDSMNHRYRNQDSPCQLCARLAEENDLLQQQLDLATTVIAHQIEMLEEIRDEVEQANLKHLNDFGFRN